MAYDWKGKNEMNRIVMSKCPSKDYCYGWNLAIEDVKSSVINNRSKAEQCLIDNGIEPDEASVVLQALGYILLDEELYPEK